MAHIQTNFTADAMNTGKKPAVVAKKVAKPEVKKPTPKPVVIEEPVAVVEEPVVVAESTPEAE